MKKISIKEVRALYKILIVEDDEIIANGIKNGLQKWNIESEIVKDFQGITKQVIDFQPHLILLDIMLPFFNGFYWCTEIRKISKAPIVFISSANDNMNIVMAMNMGGDDFIAKPFDLDVLTAKIQAILRRTYEMQGQINVLEHNGVVLNLGDTTVKFNDEVVELTKNEFKILQTLFENIGAVVSRDKLMERLWESESFIDDNTLTVNITRLRKRLEDINVVDLIKTKKGLGYIIEN